MSLADKFIKRVAPILSIVIGAIRNVTGYLSPEDDWVETVKRYLALAFDPLARPLGRPLVWEKGVEDHFATVSADPDTVEWVLDSRYQRNLTSTRKYRVINGGERDWAVGSWVHDPEDTEWQHHVYLFAAPSGGTDLYGHKETSAEHDPYGHVTDAQTHGDPDGLARSLLERRGLTDA